MRSLVGSGTSLYNLHLLCISLPLSYIRIPTFYLGLSGKQSPVSHLVSLLVYYLASYLLLNFLPKQSHFLTTTKKVLAKKMLMQ